MIAALPPLAAVTLALPFGSLTLRVMAGVAGASAWTTVRLTVAVALVPPPRQIRSIVVLDHHRIVAGRQAAGGKKAENIVREGTAAGDARTAQSVQEEARGIEQRLQGSGDSIQRQADVRDRVQERAARGAPREQVGDGKGGGPGRNRDRDRGAAAVGSGGGRDGVRGIVRILMVRLTAGEAVVCAGCAARSHGEGDRLRGRLERIPGCWRR